MPATASRKERLKQREEALKLLEAREKQATEEAAGLAAVELIPAETDKSHTFEALGLDDVLLKAVYEEGFRAPTPIQNATFKYAVEGRDILAAAESGSGKTAAFILPILQRVIQARKASNPNKKIFQATRILILTPTRELATQIEADITALANFMVPRVSSGVIFGGASEKPQLRMFKDCVDFLVACPGRLQELMKEHPKKCALKFISHLVIDEADKMFDMGFMPIVKAICEQLPALKKPRQTLLFSATLSPQVADVANVVLHDEVRFNIREVATVPVGIRQLIYRCANAWEAKKTMLVHMLGGTEEPSVMIPVTEEAKAKELAEHQDTAAVPRVAVGPLSVINAIVFCSTKAYVDHVTAHLNRHGIKTSMIHSDLSMAQRSSAIDRLKKGLDRVLVATNILARGIDIPQLTHVFNFEVPLSAADYVHRIGRTGRANERGTAISLVYPGEERFIGAIQRELDSKFEEGTLGDVEFEPKKPGTGTKKQRKKALRELRLISQVKTKPTTYSTAYVPKELRGLPGYEQPPRKTMEHGGDDGILEEDDKAATEKAARREAKRARLAEEKEGKQEKTKEGKTATPTTDIGLKRKQPDVPGAGAVPTEKVKKSNDFAKKKMEAKLAKRAARQAKMEVIDMKPVVIASGEEAGAEEPVQKKQKKQKKEQKKSDAEDNSQAVAATATDTHTKKGQKRSKEENAVAEEKPKEKKPKKEYKGFQAPAFDDDDDDLEHKPTLKEKKAAKKERRERLGHTKKETKAKVPYEKEKDPAWLEMCTQYLQEIDVNNDE